MFQWCSQPKIGVLVQVQYKYKYKTNTSTRQIQVQDKYRYKTNTSTRQIQVQVQDNTSTSTKPVKTRQDTRLQKSFLEAQDDNFCHENDLKNIKYGQKLVRNQKIYVLKWY